MMVPVIHSKDILKSYWYLCSKDIPIKNGILQPMKKTVSAISVTCGSWWDIYVQLFSSGRVSQHIVFYFDANFTCTPKILGSASRYLYFWRGFFWKVTSTNVPASPESLALCAATSDTSASGSPEEQRQKKSRISPGSVVANNNL